MAVDVTWWKKVGGVFVVLLLMLSVAGQIQDSIRCSDCAPNSTELSLASAATTHTPVSDVSHSGLDEMSCQHGHCHHGGQILVSNFGDQREYVLASALLSPARASLLTATLARRLEDPPRG